MLVTQEGDLGTSAQHALLSLEPRAPGSALQAQRQRLQFVTADRLAFLFYLQKLIKVLHLKM